MPREELISSAVEFLHDPAAASSPLENRIAFLRSKHLSQEEIDIALARSGESQQPPSTASTYGRQQQLMRQVPHNYPPYWSQQQPPPVPRRDWRDWFIMATVMGGVSWSLLLLAKRYIAPLISPPTPPQLEQDKKAIDESFSKAFDLLDQLSKDTEELKAAEKARTERLDTALLQVQEVVSELKSSLKKRDDDVRRTNDEIRSLRELVPKAIESQRDQTDGRLRELNSELKSLKTLVGTRMNATPRNANGSTVAADRPSTNGSQSDNTSTSEQTSTSSTTSSSSQPESISSFGNPISGNRASIPSWQMPLKKS